MTDFTENPFPSCVKPGFEVCRPDLIIFLEDVRPRVRCRIDWHIYRDMPFCKEKTILKLFQNYMFQLKEAGVI